MLQRICLGGAVLVVGLCSVARAEQFVLVDVSYTHSAETTKDSHYYTKPPADAPKDWTNPVDYSTGSVHIIVDVKTKPAGDTPTKFQICFEGTPSYACTLQSPTYTATGRVEWDSPFKDFWYDSTVDWSKGTKQIPLILKDTNNGKPAGDPKYMPTDLHVQLTLVSPGAKFVAPPAAGSGGAGGAAGAPAAGVAGAGTGGRGGSASAAGGGGTQSAAGSAAVGRGRAAGAAAGGGATGAAAGGGATGAANAPAAGKAGGNAAGAAAMSDVDAASPTPSGASGATGATTGAQTAAPDLAADDSGCRSAGSRSNGAFAFLAALGYGAFRRHRRLR